MYYIQSKKNLGHTTGMIHLKIKEYRIRLLEYRWKKLILVFKQFICFERKYKKMLKMAVSILL